MADKALAADTAEHAPVALAERPSKLARLSRPLRRRLPRLVELLVSVPSRLFFLFAAYYVVLTLGTIWFAQPQPANLAHWGLAFTSVWRRWDALYFLRVAQQGYATHRGLTAFFPLYPALVRVAAWPLAGHFTLAGLLVSWLCSWGTCLWFYRLVAREYGDRLARQALLFLLCCPLAFFYFAPYSESLFLLVSIGAVERARAGRPWQAGFLAALAMLTRSAGMLLLIPLGWELLRRSERFRRLQARLLLRSPRWLVGADALTQHMAAEQKWKKLPPLPPLRGQALAGTGTPGPPSPHSRSRWSLARLRLGWLSLALIPLALVGYMLSLKAATGDALAFLAGEGQWHRSLTLPWDTAVLLATSLQYTWQHQLWLVLSSTLVDILLVLPLTALVLYWSLRRRVPWFGAALYQAALALMLVAVPVHPGAAGWQEVLLSTQRLMLPAFPGLLVLGDFGAAHPRLARAVRLLSFAALTVYTLQFLHGDFIA